jgi:hypothetical protein
MTLRASITGTLALVLSVLSVAAAHGDERELWFRRAEQRWLARELRARGFDCSELRAGYEVGARPDGNHIRVVCDTAGGPPGSGTSTFRLVARGSGIARMEPWEAREPAPVLALLRASLD